MPAPASPSSPAAALARHPCLCGLVITLLAVTSTVVAAERPGAASETTPSRSEYFSWINHTNEGPTEDQTLANLRFFQWLHDEYGMALDIYAFDAGAIDGARFYGSMDSPRFHRQFPHGFGPIVERAAGMGTRLGIWGGPDGFGDTPEEEAARIGMMTSLCRDYHFALFKMDAVCGQLRPSKYDAFDRMMTACRKHSPDLILLNHRLELGPGTRHSSTYLLGGAETYIDVHMANTFTAQHHRAGAMARELPPALTRLTEDHGVCLSSCLDYWEDDLVLQAFARDLLVAPQIYGNPWLLQDNEFPRLAGLFNLHRRYRDILVHGLVLPEDRYGSGAVSRGDASTRLITLRNLTWEPVSIPLALDASIGLAATDKPIQVTQLHPFSQDGGEHAFGSTIPLEVRPFRACLVRVTAQPATEPEVHGVRYEVERDVTGQPLRIKLLGEPGEHARVSVTMPAGTRIQSATLDGVEAPELLQSRPIDVEFPGKPWSQPPHRRLAVMQPVPLPDDAEALYEATSFAGDNNALELRSLQRSGPTAIPAVQAARDAFFHQPLFIARGLSDRALFDDDPATGFATNLRWGDPRVRGGAFRLDLGAVQHLDEIVIETPDEFTLQPLKSEEGTVAQVSADLRTWHEATFLAGPEMRIDLRHTPPWRYLRFAPAPIKLTEVLGFAAGVAVDRSRWRVSTLFAPYVEDSWSERLVHRARKAWQARFTLNEVPPHSYLCVAINGRHGVEGATAALRAGKHYLGAPDRSPSYVSNTWEVPVRSVDRNYTYYFPLSEEMLGQPLEAVVLALDPDHLDLEPEVWVTAYPFPFEEKRLVIAR